MSKEIAHIRAFNHDFYIKKTNRNMRITYEYYADSSLKRKKLINQSNDQTDLKNLDLGDNKQAIKAFDAIADMSNSALALQDAPTRYIKNILKLNAKQISSMDDMLPGETSALAEFIAMSVTSDGDEDPKKPNRRPRKKIN